MDLTVHAEDDPELARLLSNRAYAQRKADDAKKDLDAIKAAIKNKLTSITDANTPGGPAPYSGYTVDSSYSDVPGVTLRWKTRRVLNQAALKGLYPHIVDEFTEIKGAWYLEEIK